MARVASGERIAVPAQSNIYTVLLGAAIVAVAMGLIVVFIRANQLGVQLLKF
jgi:hypothetical protein